MAAVRGEPEKEKESEIRSLELDYHARVAACRGDIEKEIRNRLERSIRADFERRETDYTSVIYVTEYGYKVSGRYHTEASCSRLGARSEVQETGAMQ